MNGDETFLRQALGLARQAAAAGGRPFGAVLVRDSAVIATGINEVVATGDPTAHAELQAIRGASRALGTPRLDGCVVYASGHPCPMCLSAMYLTGVAGVYYAQSQEDAEPFGLSTTAIYAELARPAGERSLRMVHAPVTMEGEGPYEVWRRLSSSG
jgi:tRNA(Arg) A34 adenosine deaminase TadA